MSTDKPRSRRNKRRSSSRVAVSTRHTRTEIAPFGSRLFAGVKWVFAWDDVHTWSEIRRRVLGGWMLVLPLVAWAFWPTLVETVQIWNNQPDYSHGFLVLPIAAYFLWARRENFPGWSGGPLWAGLGLIVFGIAVRWLGAHFFLHAVDGWALVFCLAGAVWVICGTRVFWYCLPSTVFLFLAVRLPGRIEVGLSQRLQQIATNFSTWTLQLLGQPAIAEGHTILMGNTQLEVEQACSGMRIFLGIIAIAFAYLVMVKRTWEEKVLIVIAVIPIALVANAARIVATGLLYQWVSGEAAQHFSHDISGYLMIPLAAWMFSLLLWYLRVAFREVGIIDTKRMIAATEK